MNEYDLFSAIGDYAGCGLFEEPDRRLFYRKALGLRRYYENCPLPEYHGEKLYPSGILPTDTALIPDYMDTFHLEDEKVPEEKREEIARAFRGTFWRYSSSVPQEHTVAGNMYTHSVPHYERVLQEGFSSYLERIAKIADPDLRDGLTHLVRGIENYASRCVDYLQSVNADPTLIAALRKVPMAPADNIYEAIVAWNFVLYLDSCDNLGCVASGLLPYYRGEDVTDLLRNLFDNLDINNGYSMSLAVPANPLTLQCLEASKGKRRPMIELFVDESTPKEVWDKAFEVVRAGGGQPAFYNGKVLLPGLQRKYGITDEDITHFCGGGCTESMIAGYSNVGSLDAGINLPLILESTLYQSLEGCATFDAFYDRFICDVRTAVDTVCREIGNSRVNRAKFNPLPMRTLLVDDCIDRGIEFNNGGARYRYSLINFAGMINVIDGLLNVRTLVYDEKSVTAGELLSHLRANDEDFIRSLRNRPLCHGVDNEEVNAFSYRLTHTIYSMTEGKKHPLADGFSPASIQFKSQVEAGQHVGATPDGRLAGEPLCDSLAAIFGRDVAGPTALLKSVTALDLKQVIGVPILNFNITDDFDPDVLRALILGYMSLGGIQMQITCANEELLLDAYRHPEDHRNFIVRVGGYSEYFIRLSDELKKMVIARTIQKKI